jgi:DNA-binding transcriptional MerR regulator
MTSPSYMTTAEVAELCRTSPETVRYWRHIGKGPESFKAGRRVLYPADGVRAWLAGLHREEAARRMPRPRPGTRA